MARILVVDDESLIRVLVADVGESLGHEVLTAASIKEGQDLAQRGVDIVLLDVLLPDGDGLAHVETFSQLPGRPDVIIITGHGNADAADHGTLFLDEVGELPLPVQGAFLRALELRRFRPVGEVREVESDFRLVAATNRDLDDMVGMDLYRSDLRFRLRGMTIHVPPLRRRAEDIPLLATNSRTRS